MVGGASVEGKGGEKRGEEEEAAERQEEVDEEADSEVRSEASGEPGKVAVVEGDGEVEAVEEEGWAEDEEDEASKGVGAAFSLGDRGAGCGLSLANSMSWALLKFMAA